MASTFGFNLFVSFALVISVTQDAFAQKKEIPPHYEESTSVLFGGEGGWDYLYADSDARKLYIARMNRVMVVDLDTKKLIGEVKGLNGAHGTAIAREFNQGFASSGKSGEIFVFDLKTLAVLDKIKVGENPDAIVYDAFSKSVFAFNGVSKNLSMVSAANHKVLATLPLDGKPEFAAVDGNGKVFVAIQDKNEIQVIDSKQNKLGEKFPTQKCEGPGALSIDAKRNLLIIGCDNQLAAIMDAKSGQIKQTFPVGDGVDAASFDAVHGLAFVSAGEGKMSVFSTADQGFQFVEDVKTEVGARTLAVDTQAGTVFLATAKLLPLEKGQKRPSAAPDTFKLLVVSKKPKL